MNRTVLTVVLALAVGGSVKTLADDMWATSRFFGGGLDGYGVICQVGDSDAMFKYKCAEARFTGGSKDGWYTVTTFGFKLSRRGTLITLR